MHVALIVIGVIAAWFILSVPAGLVIGKAIAWLGKADSRD